MIGSHRQYIVVRTLGSKIRANGGSVVTSSPLTKSPSNTHSEWTATTSSSERLELNKLRNFGGKKQRRPYPERGGNPKLRDQHPTAPAKHHHRCLLGLPRRSLNAVGRRSGPMPGSGPSRQEAPLLPFYNLVWQPYTRAGLRLRHKAIVERRR